MIGKIEKRIKEYEELIEKLNKRCEELKTEKRDPAVGHNPPVFYYLSNQIDLYRMTISINQNAIIDLKITLELAEK